MAQTVEAPTGSEPESKPEGPSGVEVKPTLEPRPAEESRTTRNPRSTRVMVRHVGPLSVLRFSLLYYFCVMLVLFLAFVIMYSVLDSAGALAAMGRGLVHFGFGCPNGNPSFGKGSSAGCAFNFDRGWILSRVFMIGLVFVVLWSVVKIVVSLLYNLISDIVGGVNVTLVERP